jgi:RHS repeat-associated protein
VHTGGLEASGGFYDAQADVPIHSVAPGTYYYLVKADARYETAEAPDVRANNVAPSSTTVDFPMAQLVLGTPWPDTFTQAGQDKCYRLNVPSGGNLRVSLDDADNLGVNELYVRLGTPPVPGSGGAHAYSSVGSADHAILIRGAPAGDWYVLAANVSGPGDYTLAADVSTLQLSRVTPASLGDAAPMTLTLQGVGFLPGSSVSLVAAGGGSYAAPTVSVDSFTQITASFAAGAVPAGTYTVRVTLPDSQTSELPGAFQVLVGGSASFKTDIIVPAQVGYHQLAVIYAELTNTGQLAALAPLLVISAEQEGQQRAILTLDPSILPKGLWSSAMPEGFSNTVCALATGLVPGTIQPGETVRIPVYYVGWQTPWNFSYPPIQFGVGIITADSTAPVDWTSLKTEMKPPDVSADAWDAIWSTFTTRAGSTWGGLISVVDDDASYLGRLGQTVRDFYTLAEFEIRQADGNHALPQLAGRVDVNSPAPGMNLTFSRAYPTGVSQRYKLGPLGRGWSSPIQLRLFQAADGKVTVRLNGVPVRQFQPDSRGGFFSMPGDYGVLSALGAGRFRIQESDGSVRVFRADGLLEYSEDSNQNRITMGYDASGRLASMTHSSGQVMQIAYNGAGRINTITDPVGRQTLFTYDAANEHLLSVQAPDGTSEQYTYNAATTGPLAHGLTSIQFADGTRRDFTYDAAGRLIGEARDGGAEAVTYAYDSAGQLDVTGAAAATTHLYFDYRGLMVKAMDPLDRALQMVYDKGGQLTEMIDSLGQSRTYQYDSRGNLIGLSDPAGHTATFTYETTLNRLTSLTDFAGNLTQYEYDAKGNPITKTYPDGRIERATYDPKGLLQQTTDRRGNAIGYTYDAAGRITSATYADSTQMIYVYDAHGNLTSARDRLNQTTTLAYDANDRLTRVTEPSGRYVDYTYDLAGRRTRMVDQDNLGVNYQYNDLGRLAGLTDEGGATLVTYTYDAVGRLARTDHGNGTYTAYQYDQAGQLTRLTNFAPGGAVNSRFDYTYDTLGQRTGATTPEGTWAYAYDAIGQLVSETRPDGKVVQYAYDANGNRTSVTLDGVTTTYVVNNMNQYMSVGGATYTYDADGNLTRVADGAAVTTYTYNENGQLTGTATPAGTWTYEYNALGQRVAAVRDGQRTAYQLDALEPLALVAEYDGAGTRVARYATGLGLVARTDATGKAYYDFDALGSTIGISGAAGTYLNTYSYSPFGEQLTATGTLSNPFCYVGQWGVVTDSSDLQFMQARYYLPEIGRFNSPDPIDLAGGDLNLYRYVENHPTALVDPEGTLRYLAGPGDSRIITGGLEGLEEHLVENIDPKKLANIDSIAITIILFVADLVTYGYDEDTSSVTGIQEYDHLIGLLVLFAVCKTSPDPTPSNTGGPVGVPGMPGVTASVGLGHINVGALGRSLYDSVKKLWGTSRSATSIASANPPSPGSRPPG